MVSNVKNENLDLCRECGGMCCIKCGCDYSVNDFKKCSYNTLLSELNKGDKSIVAALKFIKMPNGKYTYDAFLYVRARNVNRDIIDLVSMKTRCAQLTDKGCTHSYEDRPANGRNLKPIIDEDGNKICKPIINPLDILKTWKPYQKVLKRLVYYYTGMGVDKKISQDVENLLYDVFVGNYTDVSSLEMLELKEFVPLLIGTFPTEYNNARNKYQGSELKVLNKTKKNL